MASRDCISHYLEISLGSLSYILEVSIALDSNKNLRILKSPPILSSYSCILFLNLVLASLSTRSSNSWSPCPQFTHKIHYEFYTQGNSCISASLVSYPILSCSGPLDYMLTIIHLMANSFI